MLLRLRVALRHTAADIFARYITRLISAADMFAVADTPCLRDMLLMIFYAEFATIRHYCCLMLLSFHAPCRQR